MMIQWCISSFGGKRQFLIASTYVFQQTAYEKYSNEPGLQST